jgi:hypothetical protein
MIPILIPPIILVNRRKSRLFSRSRPHRDFPISRFPENRIGPPGPAGAVSRGPADARRRRRTPGSREKRDFTPTPNTGTA